MTHAQRLALALLVCGAVLLPRAALAQSETLYVIEHLVVSVNTTPDGAAERMGQIQSGDRVEVLERQGDQARVRLSSGEEGWVRASYLSANPPLREQLKARTDELEKLRHDKAKLESDLATARKAATEANAAASVAAASPPPAPEAPAAEPEPSEPAATDPPPPTNPPLFADEGLMPARPSWILALAVSAAALIVGFMLGWRMLDHRIRAKYGGLRIY